MKYLQVPYKHDYKHTEKYHLDIASSQQISGYLARIIKDLL